MDFVESIMQMVHNTDNVITEVSFSTKALNAPASTSPASAAPSAPADTSLNNVGILTLNLSLKSSYKSLQDLLKKLYSWDYLIGFTDISIDKSNMDNSLDSNGQLNAKLTIDLYINKI